MRRRALIFGFGAVFMTVLAINSVVLAGGRPRDVVGLPDCALVLGAGVGEDGTPSHVLEDRLAEGLELFRAGRVKTLIVSGDHRAADYDEPNAMRRWLEARGVPASVILMDHAGIDTYSSVWRAKNVFAASKVVIVTQRFHLPRALWLARSLGLDAEGAEADRRPYRGAMWFQAREVLSRTKAGVDIAIGRTPKSVAR
jgi:vancomycin permeability regulator SanA